MSGAKQAPRKGLSYRDAGVDISAGNALVDALKPLARSTRRKGTSAALGGFGGIFDLKALGYRDPVLVAANDGVGTKLKLAIDAGLLGGVGIDLVAMSVNDLVVQGAEPLFFLDYYATGKLDVAAARTVIAGIARGCRQAGCALIGGETAEMPGMYHGQDFDLAGFAVGAVERNRLLPRKDIRPGDLILGLASSGPHSNGYSLIRKVVGMSGIPLSAPAPYAPQQSLAEDLLTPTRIYVKPVLAALRQGHPIKALAHITGGGFTENIPRVLPRNLVAEIDLSTHRLPAVFGWIRRQGEIEQAEMLRTFNCGIGMILIVPERGAKATVTCLRKAGEQVVVLGRIASRKGSKPQVCYLGTLN